MTTTDTPTGTATHLTDYERQVLQAISTNYFAMSDEPEWVWSDSIKECSSECTVPDRSMGGVVASLVKKGLVLSDGWGGREACVKLTAAGAAAATPAPTHPYNDDCPCDECEARR
jgi:hypothetical protein